MEVAVRLIEADSGVAIDECRSANVGPKGVIRKLAYVKLVREYQRNEINRGRDATEPEPNQNDDANGR
jgi:hypothetical protein